MTSNIYYAGMLIDTAIVFVLLCVKSHSLVSFHQIDNGSGVNRFYTDDVSEATGGKFFPRITGSQFNLV